MPDIFDIIHAGKRLERKKPKFYDEISLDDYILDDSSESKWLRDKDRNPYSIFDDNQSADPTAFEDLAQNNSDESKFMAQMEEQKNVSLPDPLDELPELNVEVGSEKFKRKKENRLIQPIPLAKINKIKDPTKQSKLVKKEYLLLVDKYNDLANELTDIETELGNNLIAYNQNRKELYSSKDLFREISKHFPKASSLKRKLEGNKWEVKDIYDEILVHMSELSDAIHSSETAVENAVKDLFNENKELKQKITKLEVLLIESEKKTAEAPISPPSNETVQSNSQPAQPTPPKELESSSVIQTKDEPPLEKEEPEIDSHLLLNAINFIESLPDGHKYLIKVIGQEGFSRNIELFPFIENDKEGQKFFSKNGKFAKGEAHNVVRGLRDSNLLESEQINYGSRGNNFAVYSLSPLGKAIYQKITGKSPIQSEKDYLVGQHASVEHGYLIKDISSFLKNKGHNVLTEREDLTYKIDSKHRKVFDLAINDDENKKILIEVERGTHNQTDFFNIMNKIYQITSDFYFICPSDSVLHNKTQRLFYQWIQSIGGVAAVHGKIIVHFSTYDKVKQYSEGKLLDMWTSSPL